MGDILADDDSGFFNKDEDGPLEYFEDAYECPLLEKKIRKIDKWIKEFEERRDKV